MNQYGYISRYHNAILDGTVTVGKWIALWYDYVVNGLDAGRFFYSERKARFAVAFMENFLHHHEGALAPGLVKLELWQKAMLSIIFGLVFIILLPKTVGLLFKFEIVKYIKGAPVGCYTYI